jgi:micrococcal nuclease
MSTHKRLKLSRKLYKIITSVIAIIIFAYVIPYLQAKTTSTLPAPLPGYYRVTKGTDGDTIEVDMNGTTERIRMIGVDTPETHKPNSPIQCYGPEAASFTKSLVENKTVRLETDPTGDNRDRYKRLLRYVYLEDGTLLNQRLIDSGHGFAYIQFKFTKKPNFMSSQFAAQKAKIGLWSACQTHNDRGRWQSNDL